MPPFTLLADVFWNTPRTTQSHLGVSGESQLVSYMAFLFTVMPTPGRKPHTVCREGMRVHSNFDLILKNRDELHVVA